MITCEEGIEYINIDEIATSPNIKQVRQGKEKTVSVIKHKKFDYNLIKKVMKNFS